MKPPWPAPCPTGCRMGNIAILMGLYNGEQFVREQLDSFVAQTHRDWSLIVSDDGSTDDGPEIVRAFAAAHPEHNIRLIDGPRQGFAQNFVHLLTQADSDYVAFADQDDVWLPHKLAHALSHLSAPDEAAIVCGRTAVVDENLQPLGQSPLFTRGPSFGNALVQNIGGGNTMVLTRAALALLHSAAPHAKDIVSHDWWVYQVLTGCGAQVIYDPKPGLLYRQHSGNLIGANTLAGARLARLRMVLGGSYAAWAEMTITSLTPLTEQLTPDAQAQLAAFTKARAAPLPRRLRLMHQSGIRRQTRLGTLALWVTVILGWI